jgi:hypothetical protein
VLSVQSGAGFDAWLDWLEREVTARQAIPPARASDATRGLEA